jgi:hypothetical protein
MRDVMMTEIVFADGEMECPREEKFYSWQKIEGNPNYTISDYIDEDNWTEHEGERWYYLKNSNKQSWLFRTYSCDTNYKDDNDSLPGSSITITCQQDSGCIYSENEDICTIAVCSQGVCIQQYNENSCDDGNPCTENDACNNGNCIGEQRTCSDDVSCSLDYCSGGKCYHDYSGCFCNISSDCKDNNSCSTVDCITGTCISENLNISCDDNNPCTEDDWCVNKTCKGERVNVSDGNLLTQDQCLSNRTIVHRKMETKQRIQSPFGGLSESSYSSEGSSLNQGFQEEESSSNINGSDIPGEDSESREEKNNLTWLWGVIGILVLGLVGFLYWYYNKNIKKKKNNPSGNKFNKTNNPIFPRRVNPGFRRYKK